MDIANLIQHPEHLDRDTLYELRGLLALYPYYQLIVRSLLLQNLFLLHDPMFNEELRQAALYITDRKVIFPDLVEAAHYQMPKHQAARNEQAKGETKRRQTGRYRLSTISSAPYPRRNAPTRRSESGSQRLPMPAIDYVSYLLETESEEEAEEEKAAPQMKGQSLIDDFITMTKAR